MKRQSMDNAEEATHSCGAGGRATYGQRRRRSNMDISSADDSVVAPYRGLTVPKLPGRMNLILLLVVPLLFACLESLPAAVTAAAPNPTSPKVEAVPGLPFQKKNRSQLSPFGKPAVAPPDSGFKIPSQEDIGSNEVISSYRQHYRPQQYLPESDCWIAADIAMLTAILLAGGAMIWRHVRFSRFWPLPAVTLIYFGIIRGGCICPVGSVACMTIGLRHPNMIGVATAVMFLLPLVAAFVMGRVFCVAGCPLGAFQDLLGGGGRRARRIPTLPHAILCGLPVLVLAATIWLALRGAYLFVCLLDPYKTAFFWSYGWMQRILHITHGGLVEPGILQVGNLTAWGILAASVALGVWVYRPFCRFVCPYGVLLGCFSMVAIKRRHIEQTQCVKCGRCEKQCPVQAIIQDPVTREFNISSYRCIQCNRCSSICRRSGIG